MEIQIDVSISDYNSGGNLRISERVGLPDADFMVMSNILGKFHEVLMAIREAQDNGQTSK